MRRAALWEASLRYAPFGFPKHKGTPIQNCIQSSCTTVYNLTLDRGRLSLRFCGFVQSRTPVPTILCFSDSRGRLSLRFLRLCRFRHYVCLTCVQHIFNEYSISCCWVIDENVCYRSHKLAVLNDGRA